jgi:flagellar motor switch protein FliG
MMEVSGKRDGNGDYQLQMGPVTLTLAPQVLHALHEVIDQRLNRCSEQEAQALDKKFQAFKVLATKMSGVDERIIQKFAPKVSAEQLVTIVRLAEGDELRHKVLRNLSQQNRRQFEEDYARLDKITVQQACVHMEQLVPTIRLAAQEQRTLQQADS